MSFLTAAFDKHMKGKQFGENAHAEQAWSTKSDELIVQFFFLSLFVLKILATLRAS